MLLIINDAVLPSLSSQKRDNVTRFLKIFLILTNRGMLCQPFFSWIRFVIQLAKCTLYSMLIQVRNTGKGMHCFFSAINFSTITPTFNFALTGLNSINYYTVVCEVRSNSRICEDICHLAEVLLLLFRQLLWLPHPLHRLQTLLYTGQRWARKGFRGKVRKVWIIAKKLNFPMFTIFDEK